MLFLNDIGDRFISLCNKVPAELTIGALCAFCVFGGFIAK